ncbi:MAG: RcpC/CpaB family pilus assembly protein [Chloroflexi bacterium]|nr:RcpC/CpaB family pilus assembly protein [Chloroflexota bacterium]
MKRGRIFIYLALIIIIAVAAGGVYLWLHRTPGAPPISQTTPQTQYVEIVTAGQNISPGTLITEAMLSSIKIQQTDFVQGEFTNKADVVNMYAKSLILQGVVIMSENVSLTPGANLPGSTWAPFIPQGLTAVAIPIKGLASVAYGIRDGDYVNIIVTMLLVDVDPTNQSIQPNLSAGVTAPGVSTTGGPDQLVAVINSGGSKVGSATLDETLNQPLYLVPSEEQRPRLVTQMIMQNIQVLHVGSFPLPGETVSDQLTLSDSGIVATATPVPAGQQPAVVVTRPDIVTLMVSPDDANTLVFLIYSGAKITLTLRNPNNPGPAVQTDAAMLEYLLTQYNIPVPAKLPYAVQPRLDNLLDPKLPNDTSAP